MDLKVLKILFNYKGEISAKEFRIGIVIIFMTLGAYFALSTQDPMKIIFENMFYNNIDNEYFRLKDIFIYFVPNLIPVQFILIYCSFVLGIKRMRSFSSNRTLIILSGLFNYLFFCSFLSFNYLSIALSRYFDTTQVIIIAIIFCIILIVGLINILCLIREKEDEECYIEQYDKKLNIESFALKIGNLIIYIFAISLIYTILSYLFSRNSYNTRVFINILNTIVNIIFLILYIRYIVRRVRDAGKSHIWIVAILGSYIISIGNLIIAGFYFPKYFFYSSMIYITVSHLVVASQFILFLLPSKEESTSPTPPKEWLAQSDEEF